MDYLPYINTTLYILNRHDEAMFYDDILCTYCNIKFI